LPAAKGAAAAVRTGNTGRTGRVFVVSGPSGAGKGTIIKRALAGRPDILYSISATTRPPRPDESEGVDYHFISEDEFSSRRDRGGFLESAVVFGRMYGTPRPPVEDALARGRDVLLELDVQGAAQVKEVMPESILIFVETPSFEDLIARLENRGTEDAEAMARRIETAYEEVKSKADYDHVIINDDVHQAVRALVRILEQADKQDTGKKRAIGRTDKK
jgi:guanylate kinase